MLVPPNMTVRNGIVQLVTNRMQEQVLHYTESVEGSCWKGG